MKLFNVQLYFMTVHNENSIFVPARFFMSLSLQHRHWVSKSISDPFLKAIQFARGQSLSETSGEPNPLVLALY